MNKKTYKIKKKKNLFKNKFFRLGILFLILVVGIFYAVCFAPFSQIKAIKISGCQKIQSLDLENTVLAQVGKKIAFLKTQSIFLADSGKISQEILENFPQIEKIVFKKNLPNSLEILIQERSPVATLFQNNNCFFIDQNGIAYEEVLQNNWSGLKITNQTISSAIELGQTVINNDLLAKILKINSAVSNDLTVELSEIEIASEQRMNLKTVDGWQVYFNLKNDLDWQLVELTTILENKIPPAQRRNLKYIDLRFDRVFISPDGLVGD